MRAAALLLTVALTHAGSSDALEADSTGSTWFKPPWPCIVVRAEFPGMPRSGFCPSPNVARWLFTTPADAMVVGDATPIVVADAYHGVGFIVCPNGEPPVTVADAYHGVGIAVCFDAVRRSRPASTSRPGHSTSHPSTQAL